LASRNASFHERGIGGVLLIPLKWACIGTMILLGLILAAWVIDWVFVFSVWPDGIARLQGILEQELARTYTMECWRGDLPNLAAGTANVLYDLIFRASGIHDMAVRFAEGGSLSIPDTIVRNAYSAYYEEIQVAMVGTQILGVRLATLLAAMPLLGLAYGVALADGFVQRAVRRASGGRESASIYHRAKHLQLVLLVMTVSAYLLLAKSVDPRPICWALIATVAILARVQWVYYKKYL
jgi:integrating conjugative element membrane protein (TIGR03747 family)